MDGRLARGHLGNGAAVLSLVGHVLLPGRMDERLSAGRGSTMGVSAGQAELGIGPGSPRYGARPLAEALNMMGQRVSPAHLATFTRLADLPKSMYYGAPRPIPDYPHHRYDPRLLRCTAQ